MLSNTEYVDMYRAIRNKNDTEVRRILEKDKIDYFTLYPRNRHMLSVKRAKSRSYLIFLYFVRPGIASIHEFHKYYCEAAEQSHELLPLEELRTRYAMYISILNNKLAKYKLRIASNNTKDGRYYLASTALLREIEGK